MPDKSTVVLCFLCRAFYSHCLVNNERWVISELLVDDCVCSSARINQYSGFVLAISMFWNGSLEIFLWTLETIKAPSGMLLLIVLLLSSYSLPLLCFNTAAVSQRVWSQYSIESLMTAVGRYQSCHIIKALIRWLVREWKMKKRKGQVIKKKGLFTILC